MAPEQPEMCAVYFWRMSLSLRVMVRRYSLPAWRMRRILEPWKSCVESTVRMVGSMGERLSAGVGLWGGLPMFTAMRVAELWRVRFVAAARGEKMRKMLIRAVDWAR